MGIEEEFSKFTQEVEETFHEVKEHVIMSVERHSFLIAFVLMSVTSAVLLIGTVYVWCFHHHGNRNRDNRRRSDRQKDEGQQKKVPEDAHKNPESHDQDNSGSQSHDQDNSGSQNSSTQVLENQNDKVRKRIPSQSSSNLNNNESPVKSKIPVRARVKST